MIDYQRVPRVLALRHAARLGITANQARTELRRGRWTRLARGVVLTRPGPPDRGDWILAGWALTGGVGVLSGWDAARHYGTGPERPPVEQVLVLTPRGENRTVGNLHLRPSRRPLPTTGADALPIPIAYPARAVADTALSCRWLPPVRAMVTTAVQRGLATPSELAAELAAGPQNGSALLRRALDDVLDGARSIAEAEAVDYLRQAAVPPFELNVAIIDMAGRVIAVADVFWRALRAIVEIDSREFHFGELAWQATMRRHNRLTGAGLAVSHYPPSAVRQRQQVWADEVAGWLRRRARELGVEYAGDARVVRPEQDGAPPPFAVAA